MLYKPTQTHQKHITQATFSSNRRSIQHGQISILLDIPSESLTHITCFLEPSSLIALGRTNKYLNEHVANDNTWHRAFVYQFLGISPEGDLHDAKSLMLRRHESSWRKEYVLRYNLRRCVIISRKFLRNLTYIAGVGNGHITRQSHTLLIILLCLACY